MRRQVNNSFVCDFHDLVYRYDEEFITVVRNELDAEMDECAVYCWPFASCSEVIQPNKTILHIQLFKKMNESADYSYVASHEARNEVT